MEILKELIVTVYRICKYRCFKRNHNRIIALELYEFGRDFMRKQFMDNDHAIFYSKFRDKQILFGKDVKKVVKEVCGVMRKIVNSEKNLKRMEVERTQTVVDKKMENEKRLMPHGDLWEKWEKVWKRYVT